MITVKNTVFQINETFNVKLNNQIKINLTFTFNFKDRLFNKFQTERKESKFQESLLNFKNPSYVKLKILTEKRYIIFELNQNVELKEFNFKNQFFEISGTLPKNIIEKFQILSEQFKWAENILNLNNFDLSLKYYENDTNEIKISIPKNINKIKEILNKLSEIEKNSSFKISRLDWCKFEELENDILEIEFDFLDSSKLTQELINYFIKLIDTELFSEIKYYLKNKLIWVSPPEIFKYNFFIQMDKFLNNFDKYIKFFNLFKNNKFINLIVRIAKTNEIEEYIGKYFFIFERFKDYLHEMDKIIELIEL